MDSWAWAVVAAATALGVFVMVMAFRGLIEAVDKSCSRCAACGRIGTVPLPVTSHVCLHCHVHQLLDGRLSLRH